MAWAWCWPWSWPCSPAWPSLPSPLCPKRSTPAPRARRATAQTCSASLQQLVPPQTEPHRQAGRVPGVAHESQARRADFPCGGSSRGAPRVPARLCDGCHSRPRSHPSRTLCDPPPLKPRSSHAKAGAVTEERCVVTTTAISAACSPARTSARRGRSWQVGGKWTAPDFCDLDGPRPRYYLDCNLACEERCGCRSSGVLRERVHTREMPLPRRLRHPQSRVHKVPLRPVQPGSLRRGVELSGRDLRAALALGSGMCALSRADRPSD